MAQQLLARSRPRFADTLRHYDITLKRTQVTTLQINIGKLCNQACHHCHVEAGPTRAENMQQETVERLLALLDASAGVHTVDITGGAPEMNPHFRFFVQELRKRNIQVIDRCNLTVLLLVGQQDTAQFLADNHIDVVASLPCYMEENVDTQRGKHVFAQSIKALRMLNALGYGKKDSHLTLNLVYNPVGTHLPPAQATLEQDYKKYLGERYGIVFNNLFTITNMPIKRYLHMLRREQKEAEYMQLLVDNFNPQSVASVMCTSMVSVGWDGTLYDCDFNQMLDMPLGDRPTIWDIDSLTDVGSEIALGQHCFGCTAGAGSSCGGALL